MWLRRPGRRLRMERLGGILQMTASTCWWSRPRFRSARARAGSAQRLRAPALLCGRRQTQSPVIGRLLLSLLQHSIANDGRLRHRALLGDIKVVGAFELHASSRASRFTFVVDIGRRHHPVVIVGSGSRALCSYTCVQILIGHHDAWSPLGRQTWARPRVHAARESPCMFCMLSCFACVLF